MNHRALGDIAKIEHGYQFPGKFISQTPTGQILVTPVNFTAGGGFSTRKLKYYSGTAPGKYYLEKGDIIVAMTDLGRNCDILGCPARVPGKDEFGAVFLQNQRIGKVLAESPELDPGYLYWLMHTGAYRRHVKNTSCGTTVKHTSPGRILDFRFPIPPVEEQKKSVLLLDSLDERARLLERKCGVLEKIIDVRFFQIFGETVYTGTTAGRPRGRNIKPLAALGKIVCGRTPAKKYFGGGLPFIKIPDLRQGIHIKGARTGITEEGTSVLKGTLLPPGSVCVSCTATVGLVGLTTYYCHTNQQINTVIPHNPCYRHYLFCLMGAIKHSLRRMAEGRGSVMAHLNKRMFSEIPVPVPPGFLLERFNKETCSHFQDILFFRGWMENIRKARRKLLGIYFGKIFRGGLI